MDIEITQYYNSKGEATTEEEFFAESEAFYLTREKEYEKKLEDISGLINEDFSPLQKLRWLYQYFINNISYDYEVLDHVNENGYVNPVSHPYWNKWGIGSQEKYAPILLGKGSCAGIASAFNDLCVKLQIDCEKITGATKLINEEKGIYLQHTWNVVTLDEEKGQVDITYGIFNRDQGLDAMAFCFLDNESLKQIGPHHAFDEEKVQKQKGY